MLSPRVLHGRPSGHLTTGLVLLTAALLSCGQPPEPTAPSQPLPALTPSLSRFEQRIRSLPALERGLAPVESPWATDDSALVEMIRAADGYVSVGLKPAEASPTRTTRRLVTEAAHPGRSMPMGTRPALSAAAVRRGLAEVERAGAQVLEYLENLGVARVKVEPRAGLGLARLPVVDWVEPTLGPAGTVFAYRVPRDDAHGLLFSEVSPWGLDSLRVPQAWSLTRGAGARVLIIDQGYDATHEDLPALTSSQCLGIQPVPGMCFEEQLPSEGHGTYVAGVILARQNGLGVVGVANEVPAANVFMWRACEYVPGGGTGGGTVFGANTVCRPNQVVDALNWAVGGLGPLGVINMSLGFANETNALATAVAAALAANHVLVAAVGNIPGIEPGSAVYPAASMGVIGVSGLLQSLAFALPAYPSPCGVGAYYTGSHSGTFVDVAAPFFTLSTLRGNTYAGPPTDSEWCGTSFATAFVTGVAALIRVVNPTFANTQVASQLTYTARDLGTPGYDSQFGHGLVQADLAAGLTQPAITATVSSGRPRLSWGAVPMAAYYRVMRRVTPTLAPQWAEWTTTTATFFKDNMTPVSSFYGYNTYPGMQPGAATAVSYYVEAVAANGKAIGSGVFATFIPIGEPPI